MPFLIGCKRIIDTACILLRSRTGIHIFLLIGRGDKAQLYQAAGHGGKPEHSQIVLMGTHIGTPRSLTHIALHVFGQFGTVLHILVLYELKHNVALGRIEIKSTIHLLVISLLKDDCILTLGHLEVLHNTSCLARPSATT